MIVFSICSFYYFFVYNFVMSCKAHLKMLYWILFMNSPYFVNDSWRIFSVSPQPFTKIVLPWRKQNILLLFHFSIFFIKMLICRPSSCSKSMCSIAFLSNFPVPTRTERALKQTCTKIVFYNKNSFTFLGSSDQLLLPDPCPKVESKYSKQLWNFSVIALKVYKQRDKQESRSDCR